MITSKRRRASARRSSTAPDSENFENLRPVRIRKQERDRWTKGVNSVEGVVERSLAE